MKTIEMLVFMRDRVWKWRCGKCQADSSTTWFSTVSIHAMYRDFAQHAYYHHGDIPVSPSQLEGSR